MFEKVKELARNQEMVNQVKRNQVWIHQNYKTTLCGNFISRWVAVDNENYMNTNPDLNALYFNMRAGGLIKPTTLFVFCGNRDGAPFILAPENIFKLLDSGA